MWHKHWTETIYVGQWPTHGPVILPYILKTIWWTNVIIGVLDPCDADLPHKMYVGMWPTFHGPSDSVLYIEDFLMEECCTEDIQCDSNFDLQIFMYCVCQWPIFCVTVILPYMFNTISWTSLILWILVLIWATDLYFIIKQFWIIYLFLPIVVCWSLIWKYL